MQDTIDRQNVDRIANGKPVEFTVSAYRGDRYDFVATLKGEAMGPQS